MTKKEIKIIVEAIVPLCGDILVNDMLNSLIRDIPKLKEPFKEALNEYNDDLDFEEEVKDLAKQKFVAAGNLLLHWMCNREYCKISQEFIDKARKELGDW